MRTYEQLSERKKAEVHCFITSTCQSLKEDSSTKEILDALFDEQYRICDVCGRLFTDGYYDWDYFCSDECLYTKYKTKREWACAYWMLSGEYHENPDKFEKMNQEEFDAHCQKYGDEINSECYYTQWEGEYDQILELDFDWRTVKLN